MMKKCPRCKRLYEDVWQVCGDCKIRLVPHRLPTIVSCITWSAALALFFCALIPVASGYIVAFDQEQYVPQSLRHFLPILTKPAVLVLALSVLVLDFLFVFTLIVRELLHPGEREKLSQRPWFSRHS